MTVLLLYVVPLRMSMRLVALVVCGIEVVQISVFHWMPEVAHSAHLGGAAFGAFYTLAGLAARPEAVFAFAPLKMRRKPCVFCAMKFFRLAVFCSSRFSLTACGLTDQQKADYARVQAQRRFLRRLRQDGPPG